MKSGYYWKWFFVVFVVAWAITEMSPPKSKNLVDHFALEVDRSDAANSDVIEGIVARARELETANPGREYANLLDAVGSADLRPLFPAVTTETADNPNREILNSLQSDAAGQIRLGLDLQGGISFMVAMQTNKLRADQERDVVIAQAIEVLRKRLDKFGVAEPSLQPVGEDRILIQLPGLSEVDYQSARETLTKPAYLEFRLVHEQSQTLLAQGMLAPGYEILSEKVKEANGVEKTLEYLVKKKPEQGLTGKHLSQAGVYPDPMTGRPKIDFQMTSEGASLFADVTSQNTGRQLAIVLDGELKSAPSIRGPIVSGRGEISGNYDLKEAFELANVLENPLEAPVEIVEEQTVEPTLGRDSIQSGVKASLVGLILVAGFMAAYYLMAGMIANFALLLNLVILLGVLCSVDATLTLPGIAGIVLTIGMAVDANVLILERIREELSAGKSTRGSVEAGYNKAFGTIFDANVTTLIASVILIFMGKGPVQGFGVTLTIGILASMFTALVVTRLVFQGLLGSGMLKAVSMMKLGLLHNHQFDFMRHWKRWFAISWGLIAIGLIFGVVRGGSVMGVDFAGGDSQVFQFEQATEVGTLRAAVGELGIGSAQISYQRSLGSGTQTLKVTSAAGSGDQILTMLAEKFPESGYKLIQSSKVGGIVGKEIQKSAIISVVLALFGILFYVALRYEFSFAIGAVLAVIHDILMTLGWFFMTGRELNAPMVAAILTVIGFSINDTIVIFDRIREDLKLGVRGTFREIMNSALNKCLSRTIITSGTTFLAAASLYIFGGSVINDFSFTFLIGIITGTYSSIYIASSIVLWWTKGEKPDLSETSPDVVLASSGPQEG